MTKYLGAFTLALLPWMAAAQTSSGVTRDPNPPYGAAAGAVNNRPAAGVAGTGSTTAGATAGSSAARSAPGASLTQGRAAAPATAPGGSPPSSGASASGSTGVGGAGARPSQTVTSSGSSSAAAAPYDPRTAPGWTMMTPQEQQSYSGRMSSFTSAAECRAYQQAYMAQIEARARSMGQIVQSPAADPCVGLR